VGRGDGFHRGGIVGADQGLTRLFYDGNCGLCRGAVRFTARRDRSGEIRFAPLGGITFGRLVPADARDGLPDSLVVLTPQGSLMTRSGAVVHLLGRMGPGWRGLGLMLAWIPEGLRDAVYDLVARNRPRSSACPMDRWTQGKRFEP
jgi:predicted DCC family thiol-disulfide oxidoreductase YuxK